ncbi:ABC transporter substrate-binding protein [Lipingzhangella sp. LS1_29]|uniref:ABC transporter substrate-binding protein n=1 Tax=Lipingzhangella rawalii TaxID=2055835 RepID=A0ABU2H6X0_9ACTN|nr:ABC transporter substrate-binding protein [Lipingzhangella rawalii]MDS1270600.1 ABC transporter substrate-binding protein [Lipingzhangella rawalii]
MTHIDARTRGVRTLAPILGLTLALGACSPTDGGDGGTTDEGGQAAGDTIQNCDIEVPADEAPERVFAAYQPAIEMAHALGISDRLVGTAYLDAEVLPEYAEAQEAQEYYANIPSREELLNHDPDFVLSGFNGVFADGGDGSFGTRTELRELGIESWIFSPLCPSEDGGTDESIDPSTVTMDSIYADLHDLGTIFGVEERAEEVVTEMQETVSETEEIVAEAEDTPSVVIGRPDDEGFRVTGEPDFSTVLLEHAGAENPFADLDEARNIDVSTEELIERDPDYILVDVCCDAEMTAADAADGVAEIRNDPALANVTAVEEDQVLEFTFADRSAGVRSAPVVAEIAEMVHPELYE